MFLRFVRSSFWLKTIQSRISTYRCEGTDDSWDLCASRNLLSKCDTWMAMNHCGRTCAIWDRLVSEMISNRDYIYAVFPMKKNKTKKKKNCISIWKWIGICLQHACNMSQEKTTKFNVFGARIFDQEQKKKKQRKVKRHKTQDILHNLCVCSFGCVRVFGFFHSMRFAKALQMNANLRSVRSTMTKKPTNERRKLSFFRE